MNTSMRLMILFAGLFVGLTAACSLGSDGSTEVRGDSFSVGDSPSVVVNGENGRVTLIAGPNGRVDVTATIKKPEDVEYEISQEGDVITVTAETSSGGLFNFGESGGVDIEITTPPNTSINIKNSNGTISVVGIKQSGSVRTSNGKVVMEGVYGDFDISTSNGSVTITQAAGSFNIKTSNGRITFDGELISGGDNKMTTSNGSVEIKLQGTPSLEFDGSTSNGSVSTEYPILTSYTEDQSHLVGKIGSGDAALLVRTSNGSIEIR
jgi:DUF4097 and DUF4098 domain-containing protein YvlB